jgi:hypothetical protein
MDRQKVWQCQLLDLKVQCSLWPFSFPRRFKHDYLIDFLKTVCCTSESVAPTLTDKGWKLALASLR